MSYPHIQDDLGDAEGWWFLFFFDASFVLKQCRWLISPEDAGEKGLHHREEGAMHFKYSAKKSEESH